MHPLPLRRLLLCLGAGLALAALPQPAGAADKPGKVKFTTADGVELHGLFYPSTKRSEGPCAILLHDLRGRVKDKGWDELAAGLHKQGFAVLWFDFRGHGDSTSIDPARFWENPFNQRFVRGYRPTMPPETITVKAFNPGYYPFLINDIAAAKVFLDNKNDQRECNSSSVVLIGAGQGATLGALWLKAERYRHRATPDPFGRPAEIEPKSEARDYIAAVWLSLSPALGPGPRYSPAQLFTVPKNEKQIPMAFLHGQKDLTKGFSNAAATFLDPTWNKRKKGKKVKDVKTGAYGIEDSDKLKGRDLLRDSLETQKWILDYLGDIVEDGLNQYEKKDFREQEYVWLVRPQIIKPAKQPKLVFLPPFP